MTFHDQRIYAEACASYLLLHAAVCGARRIRFDNDAGFVFVHLKQTEGECHERTLPRHRAPSRKKTGRTV